MQRAGPYRSEGDHQEGVSYERVSPAIGDVKAWTECEALSAANQYAKGFQQKEQEKQEKGHEAGTEA